MIKHTKSWETKVKLIFQMKYRKKKQYSGLQFSPFCVFSHVWRVNDSVVYLFESPMISSWEPAKQVYVLKKYFN